MAAEDCAAISDMGIAMSSEIQKDNGISDEVIRAVSSSSIKIFCFDFDLTLTSIHVYNQQGQKSFT